jgi:hypothetical protein
MYRHFNFEAMQLDTSISLFFAEVIPDGEEGTVTCCKLLGDNDNGMITSYSINNPISNAIQCIYTVCDFFYLLSFYGLI